MSALVVLPGEGKAVHMGGLGVVFKLLSTDTSERFAVVEHPLAPGALGGPRHTHHNEEEASYVLEGEIMVQVGDQIIEAPAGTLIYKPREIPHAFWNQRSTPARVLEIISPGGFERYFDELAQIVSAGSPPDRARLSELARKYDLDLDMSSVPEYAQKYHVTLEPPK